MNTIRKSLFRRALCALAGRRRRDELLLTLATFVICWVLFLAR